VNHASRKKGDLKRGEPLPHRGDKMKKGEGVRAEGLRRKGKKRIVNPTQLGGGTYTDACWG